MVSPRRFHSMGHCVCPTSPGAVPGFPVRVHRLVSVGPAAALRVAVEDLFRVALQGFGFRATSRLRYSETMMAMAFSFWAENAERCCTDGCTALLSTALWFCCLRPAELVDMFLKATDSCYCRHVKPGHSTGARALAPVHGFGNPRGKTVNQMRVKIRCGKNPKV